MKAFETYHPLILFYYFISVITMAMFFMHPVYLFITFTAAVVLRMLWQKGQFWQANWFYLPLFFVMALVNPLISHNGEVVLFYMNGNAVTLEAIAYGVALAVMIVTVMLWFASYHDAMTSDKFLYLFGKLSPALALTISITMRLIPRFKQQLYTIAQAQKTIGMDYTVGSLWHRVKSIIRILSILVTWALENSIDTADSMKARGYGLENRSTFSLFTFEKRDVWMGSLITLLVIGCVIGIFRGHMTFYYYPTFSSINWSMESMVFYSIYICLVVIPIVTELKEVLRWRYLQSKM